MRAQRLLRATLFRIVFFIFFKRSRRRIDCQKKLHISADTEMTTHVFVLKFE